MPRTVGLNEYFQLRSSLRRLCQASAFLGAAATGSGAVLARLLGEPAALCGARVAGLGAEGAPFRGKPRVARHCAGASLTAFRAIEAQPQAFRHARISEAARDTGLAGDEAIETGPDAGVIGWLCHGTLLAWLSGLGCMGARALRPQNVLVGRNAVPAFRLAYDPYRSPESTEILVFRPPAPSRAVGDRALGILSDVGA